MAAYYNEIDKKTAAWLRELIKNGLIADGVVDDRSIIDVKPNDLAGFDQCHFFAGIGGWSYALRLANWSDDKPVWTASLPCQPFSVAGSQKGKDDERHLLPHFLELIKQCKPNTIFGEQVEGAIRHGWLDDLQTTMEAENYAIGHCILGAHSVNAPHQRQRLYWVANSNYARLEGHREHGQLYGSEGRATQDGFNRPLSIGMGNSEHDGYASIPQSPSAVQPSENQQSRPSFPSKPTGASKPSDAADISRCQGRRSNWDNPVWVYCRDRKYRPIEPSSEPLAHGIPTRVVRLRGYGNAIVPQVAAEFISAYMYIRGV